MSEVTTSQKKALGWLRDHNGDGCFDKNGVLIAAGEAAPFMRATWNALRDAELLEFYRIADTGRGRARLTESGKTIQI